MASRPVFIPLSTGKLLVATKMIEFQWCPGMSKLERQKSVVALHVAAIKELDLSNILEVSTKSLDSIGVQLSAFSLKHSSRGKVSSLESVYQSSKVFEQGGPFTDLCGVEPGEAKSDERLKAYGQLIGFRHEGVEWKLEPKTAFYDWLYLKTINENEDYAYRVQGYDAFTDIEFNPKKSLGCQAYSIALYISLLQRGLLSSALRSNESYLSTLAMFEVGQTQSHTDNCRLF